MDAFARSSGEKKLSRHVQRNKRPVHDTPGLMTRRMFIAESDAVVYNEDEVMC